MSCQRARWCDDLEQGINTAKVRGSGSRVAHFKEKDAGNPMHTRALQAATDDLGLKRAQNIGADVHLY